MGVALTFELKYDFFDKAESDLEIKWSIDSQNDQFNLVKERLKIYVHEKGKREIELK